MRIVSEGSIGTDRMVRSGFTDGIGRIYRWVVRTVQCSANKMTCAECKYAFRLLTIYAINVHTYSSVLSVRPYCNKNKNKDFLAIGGHAGSASGDGEALLRFFGCLAW
jgi:hypothetical protein